MKPDKPCPVWRCILLSEAGENPPKIRRSTQWKNGNFASAAACPWTEDAGTEADGARSGDYCHYCYQNGAFTAPGASMDDIIAFNLKFNEENGHPFGPQKEAEAMMRSWFPTLKRWKNP